MLRIEELDPFDDEQMSEYHSVYDAAERHQRRYSNSWALEEMRAMLRGPSTYVRRLALFARMEGAMVGVASLELPQKDNTSLAEIAVHVAPAWRCQGIGARLAHHVVELARAEDRALLSAWVPGREVDAPPGTVTPGEHLARSFGLKLGLLEVQRRLSLPVPAERLDELASHAASHHDGYSLVSWMDACPDEQVAAYCALKAAMLTAAPTGDLKLEDEFWDEARLREIELEMRASGRTRHVCVAVAPDGTLVGHNELIVPDFDPGVVFQWDTLVRPDHRGRRLGLALKVQNLRNVQSAHPERSNVRTFNAESNTHMVAVNEAIGFRAVEYMGEWQGQVPA